MRIKGLVAGVLALAGLAAGAAEVPQPREGDVTVRNFAFRSGETLPELKLHYYTLGTPKRDASGHVTNAVMLLHGTGGTGRQFLRPQFAETLLVPGGLLDPARYYVIMPDGIGHGGSSKPSDGLHAHFPHYDYDDMVEAHYKLLTEGLKIDHLRLLFGTSMGCMQGFVWGETHPAFADALMTNACLPVPIAGRNRFWRKMLMDAITGDPAWAGGDYQEQPKEAMRVASGLLVLAGAAPLPFQLADPTRDQVDRYYDEHLAETLKTVDANDLLYQVDSSRDYDPSPKLGLITAQVMWVNSADDFINPPELGIAEQKVKDLKHGEFVLIPLSADTHGHGTHTWAKFWQDKMAHLLEISAPKQGE
jgi:homoserine O-acetyltransferase